MKISIRATIPGELQVKVRKRVREGGRERREGGGGGGGGEDICYIVS